MRSDVELFQAWRGGDRRAGNALIDRYYTRVYRFLQHRVGDRAEDLVQETFLACVCGMERFARGSSFRTYMLATARRMVHRANQRQARDARILCADAAALADTDASPFVLAARSIEHRLLHDALHQISWIDRITLELYFWEGLTGAELGVALGVPEPTARGRIRHALAELRRAIARLHPAIPAHTGVIVPRLVVSSRPDSHDRGQLDRARRSDSP